MSGLPDVLHRLLTAAGPSGAEQAAAAVFREAAAGFGAEVRFDSVGSTVATVGGTAGGRSLAFVGHIDEIGLMVHHIDDEGFLWFSGVGGWDATILVGQRLELHTRGGTVRGVVGKKPIHLLESEERKQAPELKQLHIDIGARDGEEARGLVRVGDVAVIAGEPVELPNGRAVSRSLDNRIGAFVALEAARLVKAAGGAPGDVHAVASAQEEITFAGAMTTAYSLRPEVAIAVEVTFETKQPGVEVREEGSHPFGSGPVISRGSTLDPLLSERLIETAEAEGLPYTLYATQRATSTDADALHRSRAGIPTGLVAVPLRYMHSPVEMVQLDDVEATARLLAAFAQRLSPDDDFRR